MLNNVHLMVKPEQQTFTGNGITISFPIGYKTVHDYIVVLKLNMKTMAKNPKKYAALLLRYENDLKQAEKAVV